MKPSTITGALFTDIPETPLAPPPCCRSRVQAKPRQRTNLAKTEFSNIFPSSMSLLLTIFSLSLRPLILSFVLMLPLAKAITILLTWVFSA